MQVLQSSVDLSPPTILLSQVRIPGTPSTLLPFIVKLYDLSHWVDKRTKINKKEAGFVPLFFTKVLILQSSFFELLGKKQEVFATVW